MTYKPYTYSQVLPLPIWDAKFLDVNTTGLKSILFWDSFAAAVACCEDGLDVGDEVDPPATDDSALQYTTWPPSANQDQAKRETAESLCHMPYSLLSLTVL